MSEVQPGASCSAGLLLCELFHVCLVLDAWRCLLVLDEVAKPNERHFYATVGSSSDIRLCLFVRDAVNVVNKVDARWDDTERQHVALGREGFRRQILLFEPESDQGLPETTDVLLSGIEEHVYILREPWMAVVGHRVAAHNHVVNAVFFE